MNQYKRFFGTSLSGLVFGLLLFCSGHVRGSAHGEEPRCPIREPFVIGAHFSDFQSYSGVSYFHGGIDLVGSAGMPVFTTVSGTVEISRYRIDAGREPRRFSYERVPFHPTQPLSEYSARYVEVAVIDVQGRRWMFRHLDGGTISPELLAAARTGTIIPPGTRLGCIIPWSESIFPEARRYDHLHLELIDTEGWYLNPALFFQLPPDTIPPAISDLFLTTNEGARVFEPRSDGMIVVSGTIDLLARIEDRAEESGYLRSPYQVDLEFGPSVSSTDPKLLASMTVFRFDRLPIRGDRTQGAGTIYREILETASGTVSSVGDNQLRRSWLCLTNGTVVTGYAPEAGFDTTRFPDGDYQFTVTARDLSGNASRKPLGVRIRNTLTGAGWN